MAKLIRVLRHEIINSLSPVISLSTTISRYFLKEDRETAKTSDEINDIVIKQNHQWAEYY